MAIVFYEPCNNFNKWTKTETDGTISVSSGTFVFANHAGSASNTLGIVSNNSFGPVDVGWTWYAQVMPIGGTNLNAIIGLFGNSTLTSTKHNSFSTGDNQDQLGAEGASTSGGSPARTDQGNDTCPNGAWTDLKIEYTGSDGLCELSYRATPGGTAGAFDPDAATWTLCSGGPFYSANSNIIGASTFIQSYLIFNGNGTSFAVDEIYITDNGSLLPHPQGSMAYRLNAGMNKY